MKLVTDLSDFLIPKISEYEPDFGTMKESGGLTTKEVSENIMYPLLSQRGFTVTESSQTSDLIARNSKFLIEQENVTLTIGRGIDGVEIYITNKTLGIATVIINENEIIINSGKSLQYVFENDSWKKIEQIQSIESITDEDGKMNVKFVMQDGTEKIFVQQSNYTMTQKPANPQIGDIWLE